MLLDNIDYSKKHDFTLVLTKKSKQPICILKEVYNRNLERNLDTFDKLSFAIPKYIEDSITHEQKENPNYDKVMVENMILLKCGEASNPIFQSYFIIKNITESSDQTIKQVECSSREVMLNKNTITINDIERQLKKDDVNISNGVFDILETECTWKLGYLQESAKIDNINGGSVSKYRWFDALSKPIYQFLSEDVQSAFNVLITYDTLNKLINVYDRDNYGTHTGLILSEENYIKNLNKKTNSESVVTKLEVTGRDELTFEDVNILGTSYILNYDYYINNGQMSDSLVTALAKYNTLLNTKNTEFQNLKGQVDLLQGDLVLRQGEMTTLNEELKALRILQSTYMSEGNNIDLPQATTNVNNKVIQIANKQAEITSLQNQINNINVQIVQIANDINKKNAKDESNNLIFNVDLLEELEDFTYCESWNNNYYSNSQQLYNAAIDVLKDWSVPPIEFELDMVDLFSIAKAQKYWDKIIKLGDLVRVYSSKMKTNTDVRIVGYSYNIDGNDLKVSFSNKNSKLDDKRGIASAVKKSTEASKILNTKKLKWNEIKDTKNAVETFLNNNLDVARQNIYAMQGRNKFDISENGQFIVDAQDDNKQLVLVAGQLVVTSDGLQTVDTAINSDGVFANMLVGRILAGTKLYISNEANNVTIDEYGLTLKDANNGYKTLISPQGIMSADNFGFPDSVDIDHPMVIDFFVDDNVNVIDKVMLKLSVQDFRAYSKGSASGGSSTTTSTSGGGYNGTITTPPASDYDNDNSTPIVTNNTNTPTDGTPHQHYLPNDMLAMIYNHTHSFSVNIANHSHSLSLVAHEHNLVPGIFTTPKTIGNMDIYIDGILRSTVSGEKILLDVTSYITTKGWHQITVSSSALNRYSASIYIKSYIGA